MQTTLDLHARIHNELGVDVSSPVELKVSLLSKGVACAIDLFARHPGDFYANRFVYGNTSKSTLWHRLPQVVLLGDSVISAFLRREDSPWSVDIQGDELALYYKGQYVRRIELPEVPPYFGKTLRDGTRTEEFIAVAGEATPGYFVFPECFYFDEGLPCGFCSLKGTRKNEANNMATVYTQARVTEATRLFQATPWRDIPLVTFTAGTALTDAQTKTDIIDPIRFTYDALDPKIPIHALVHPPNDFRLIEEYKAAGVSTIAFNLEVYDRTLFEKICPGKDQRYGYDKWLDACDAARDVFGRYKVFCGLVWGLEPPERSMEGHERLVERGFGIAHNIFHNDPRSVMQKHPHPSEREILKISRYISDLFIRFPDCVTIFPMSQRSTIDWELRRGDLN